MDRAKLVGLDRELAERFYLAGDRFTIADNSAQCAFFLGIGRTSTFHELTAARQETIASLAGEPLATLAPQALSSIFHPAIGRAPVSRSR